MADEPSLFGIPRWPATELGVALCLSTQRINQLVKEGVLAAPLDGLYLPREAVRSYVQHLRKREAGRSHADEATKKLRLENQMREIKLQRIASTVVPVDRVQKDWFEAGRRVRDGLLNLPSRLSGVFAAESNQDKIFDLFEKEVHQVLTALSPSAAREPVATLFPLEETTDQEQSPDTVEATDEGIAHDSEEADGEPPR